MPPTDALRARDPEAFRAELRAVLRDGQEDWERDWRDLLVALAPSTTAHDGSASTWVRPTAPHIGRARSVARG